jgi:hypothetical protein
MKQILARAMDMRSDVFSELSPNVIRLPVNKHD